MRQCYGEQATVATHDSWTYEQYLHDVVALEVDARRQHRIARYLRASRLPPEKSWDSFNRKRLPRKIDVQLNTLRDGTFIDRHENVVKARARDRPSPRVMLGACPGVDSGSGCQRRAPTAQTR